LNAQPQRAETLRSDPAVLAIRHTAATVSGSTLMSWQQRQLEAEVEAPPRPARDDRASRVVRRMSEAAASDDGYRVQLIDLAALHGGLYLEAVRRSSRSNGRASAPGRRWSGPRLTGCSSTRRAGAMQESRSSSTA
jgi:hypothetical protein